MNTQSIQDSLNDAVQNKVFPNAELLVAHKGKTLLHTTAGKQTATYFDLASLTKPLCTALCIAKLCEQNKIQLTQTVSDFFETQNLKNTNLQSLLNHTSGLRDWYPFYKKRVSEQAPNTKRNRTEILDLILNELTLQTGEPKTVYSDLGYIVLGRVIESVTKKTLDKSFIELVAKPLAIQNDLFFNPLEYPFISDKNQFFPSETSESRQRDLQGEVMDDNCYALGGVSGHAGLFGTAQSIHSVLLELRKSSLANSSFLKQSTFQTFCTPNTNRNQRQFYFTLGFDTPTYGLSQSGSQMSSSTIGHLGFSGTSFWWDQEKDLWIILLTNRCYPDRKNFKISDFRPQFHDSILNEILE